MKPTIKQLLVTAATAALAFCSHAQNLIVNGSFESPVISSGFAAVPTNQMAPWRTNFRLGDNFEIWKDGFSPAETSVPTYSAHGTQNIEVQGGGTAVWQAVATVVGEDYQLSFSHTPRPTVHTTLTLAINSNVVATFDEDGTGFSGFKWRRFSTNFTATTASTTITFSDAPFIGGGTHIDNVVLERLPLRSTLRVSEVELCWETVASKVYQVQYRSALTTNAWIDWGVATPGTGTTNCVKEALPVGEAQRFYRVITVP